jgi:hypothetical protein
MNPHHLRPRRSEVSSFWARVEKFEQQNFEAARIITSDPGRYPSPGLQHWAQTVLSRVERRRAA